MARKLWVVERWTGLTWAPAPEASATRADGRTELGHWRDTNPGDSYRLCCYVPAEGRDA